MGAALALAACPGPGCVPMGIPWPNNVPLGVALALFACLGTGWRAHGNSLAQQHDLGCYLGLGYRPWAWLRALAMATCMPWPLQCAHDDKPSPWLYAHRAVLA